MNSKIMAVTVALSLVLAMVFAIAGPVAATPTTWNVSGTWVFNYGEGNSTGAAYDLTLIQTGAALSGNAGYPAGIVPPASYQYTFNLTGGGVTGAAINWTATYASTVDAAAVGCTLQVIGTIAADGTMSGTWTDNYPNKTGSRSGIWKTTTGQAAQTGTSIISGTDAAPSIVFAAPGPVDLDTGGMMVAGWNIAGNDTGSVTLTQGTSGTASWTVTATGASNMINGAETPLANYLLLGNTDATPPNSSGSNWYIANGGSGIVAGSGGWGYSGTLTYNGKATGNISFYAAQWVVPTDALGAYTDTITFTASCMP